MRRVLRAPFLLLLLQLQCLCHGLGQARRLASLPPSACAGKVRPAIAVGLWEAQVRAAGGPNGAARKLNPRNARGAALRLAASPGATGPPGEVLTAARVVHLQLATARAFEALRIGRKLALRRIFANLREKRVRDQGGRRAARASNSATRCRRLHFWQYRTAIPSTVSACACRQQAQSLRARAEAQVPVKFGGGMWGKQRKRGRHNDLNGWDHGHTNGTDGSAPPDSRRPRRSAPASGGEERVILESSRLTARVRHATKWGQQDTCFARRASGAPGTRTSADPSICAGRPLLAPGKALRRLLRRMRPAACGRGQSRPGMAAVYSCSSRLIPWGGQQNRTSLKGSEATRKLPTQEEVLHIEARRVGRASARRVGRTIRQAAPPPAPELLDWTCNQQQNITSCDIPGTGRPRRQCDTLRAHQRERSGGECSSRPDSGGRYGVCKNWGFGTSPSESPCGPRRLPNARLLGL